MRWFCGLVCIFWHFGIIWFFVRALGAGRMAASRRQRGRDRLFLQGGEGNRVCAAVLLVALGRAASYSGDRCGLRNDAPGRKGIGPSGTVCGNMQLAGIGLPAGTGAGSN